MPLALDRASDQFSDRLVHQRLSAANRHDRCAALVNRGKALLERQLRRDGVLIFPDPTATRASEIASVQGLQHQHQGKALPQHRVRLGPCGTHVPSGQNREGAVGGGWVTLPFRPWEQRVLGNIRAHTERAG